MRLTPEQVTRITQIIRRHLGDSARIWLFGSRVADRKRGGDVDLYVEAPGQPLMNEVRCKVQLQEVLDLPVDLVVKRVGETSPVAQIVKASGPML